VNLSLEIQLDTKHKSSALEVAIVISRTLQELASRLVKDRAGWGREVAWAATSSGLAIGAVMVSMCKVN
jgi:hypothetical protein